MANVEIIGADELKAVLRDMVPYDLRPPVLREIARKPANKAANIARQLMPIGDTGRTAKTIGTLKVKNPKATYLEVGFRGQSLGHIYMSAPLIKRRKRGTVKGFPWLFNRTGEITSGLKINLATDMTKAFVKAFRRRGLGR